LEHHPSLRLPWISHENGTNGLQNGLNGVSKLEGKVFVASVSPQARASLAAAYGMSSDEAGNMIAQLLSGPRGLAAGGQYGSSFEWIIDTNIPRSIALVAAHEEVSQLLVDPNRIPQGDGSAISDEPKKPILTSACPGWICYAEKTHPHVLPHLSRLKSPQALTGTLLKSVLYKTHNIHPSQVWHLAIMPCFDKKLEASRSELTSAHWCPNGEPVRDVDCVITPRELISLASARNIDFSALPLTPIIPRTPFPDATLSAFLFPTPSTPHRPNSGPDSGTSGGYLWHILRRMHATHAGSSIVVMRGRNADVLEYALMHATSTVPILKCARYYGFRNIQNLVRKLKPARTSRLLAATGAKGQIATTPTAQNVDYTYVEVMACPGGCTNGGGQIRVGEADLLRAGETLAMTAKKTGPAEQRALLAVVDEAYYSGESSDGEDDMELDGADEVDDGDVVDGISRREILHILDYWASITGIEKQELVCTSFRKVESDVGKKKSDVDRVVGLASSIGGGW
jgi:iron only hydrogenase large subunit-like protein